MSQLSGILCQQRDSRTLLPCNKFMKWFWHERVVRTGTSHQKRCIAHDVRALIHSKWAMDIRGCTAFYYSGYYIPLWESLWNNQHNRKSHLFFFPWPNWDSSGIHWWIPRLTWIARSRGIGKKKWQKNKWQTTFTQWGWEFFPWKIPLKMSP